MKKTTILNAQLSHRIAALGHTDSLTVCDAGLPIPDSVERIDLALTAGIPGFLETLDVIITEMFVERAVLAEEIKQKNPQILTALLAHLSTLEQRQNNQITIDYVSHEQFKLLSHSSKAIVRSGECTPYANVILYSGVPF
ncbi:MAG TPA: D-ribose pyranase [Pasteurellaceae bacterium]|nr:D-ribose pyranase [Pasteurellaceae bacterium]